MRGRGCSENPWKFTQFGGTGFPNLLPSQIIAIFKLFFTCFGSLFNVLLFIVLKVRVFNVLHPNMMIMMIMIINTIILSIMIMIMMIPKGPS